MLKQCHDGNDVHFEYPDAETGSMVDHHICPTDEGEFIHDETEETDPLPLLALPLSMMRTASLLLLTRTILSSILSRWNTPMKSRLDDSIIMCLQGKQKG